MKIAIDARMIKNRSMHGIARYVFELVNGLSKLPSEHQFVVLVSPNSPLLNQTWPNRIKLVQVKSNWIGIREQWEIPMVLRQYKIDLFHSPSFVAPVLCPCKMIMTIHDLNHLVLPQYYTLFHQLYYRLLVKYCIKKSHSVLTVSHFSKSEILKHIKVEENKIFVTYNGVNPAYRPIKDQEQLEYVRQIYELPEKFILCVSSNKPHKNVKQLVKAYCMSNISIPLVLASPADRSILELLESYGKKHLVYFSKFIDEEHLPAVYSLTSLFVYPSTYEGFGLPPLEALSCGAPVVVSKASSLPEVVGADGIYADPYDANDIARALERGVNDLEIKETAERRADLHKQRFSWEEMCIQTLMVFDVCLSAEGSIQEPTTRSLQAL